MVRFFRQHHLQLNAVPIPKEAADNAKSVAQDIGDGQNIQLDDIPEHSSLRQMVPAGAPYVYFEFNSSKERLYHRVRSGFPIHFGREVLCCPNLLDLEDRIDWRECKGTKEEETEMTKEFRKKFQPFDFTLDDDDSD